MGAGASASSEHFEHIVNCPDDGPLPDVSAMSLSPPPPSGPETNTTKASTSSGGVSMRRAGHSLSLLLPEADLVDTKSPETHVDSNIQQHGLQRTNHPPALLSYLRCVFFSKLKNKAKLSMSVEDFLIIVETLFIHILSDFDISRLEQYLDVKTDAPVSWREANTYFQVQFKLLKRRGVDLWVGLKSFTEKGHYFWYNVKDDCSKWMTEQETIMFMRAMMLPPAERPKISLVPTPVMKRVDTPKVVTMQAKVVQATRSSPHSRSPCNSLRLSRAPGAVSHAMSP